MMTCNEVRNLVLVSVLSVPRETRLAWLEHLENCKDCDSWISSQKPMPPGPRRDAVDAIQTGDEFYDATREIREGYEH